MRLFPAPLTATDPAAEPGADAVVTHWRICVTDNGPGIPEGELDLVFEKFRQSAIGGAKPAGTGLGLPISRQIIDNLGGRIWAENTPQKGATLCFDLPAHHPADSID